MNFNTLRKAYQKLWQKKVVKPPYNHVVQIGDPILRIKARNVDLTEFNSDGFKQLMKNIHSTMKRYDCAGLSAPQLGVDLRMFVIRFPDVDEFNGTQQEYKNKQMQHIPYTVWINPEMKIVDYEKVIFSEGCESMRGFSADVARYKKILLTGLNEEGKQDTCEMSGWPARIVQHEMDHLDGKLFVDLMKPHSLTCICWNRINMEEGNIHLAYYPRKIKLK